MKKYGYDILSPKGLNTRCTATMDIYAKKQTALNGYDFLYKLL